MKKKLSENEENNLIGSNSSDLNQENIRCELCGNLLTNDRLSHIRLRNNVHYTCDRSCYCGLANRLRMKNPEFKDHISKLAKEQAKREIEDRSKRMKELNKVIWNNPEFREKKSKEFKETIDNLWKDSEYRKRHSELLHNRNISKIEDGTHNFTDFESRCYVERDSLIARYSSKDFAYLYECDNYNDHYKLGFTTDPNYRFSGSSDRFLWKSKPLLLVKGSVNEIAELECQLKLKFSLRDKGMEVYDINERNNILNFISSYIQGSTTIEKLELNSN